MGHVLVVGGYGVVGLACVQELADTTEVRIALAGRSVQRAEQAAMAFGENVQGIYADASDARTLRSLLPGAAVLVCCSGSEELPAVDAALECRVPFVGLSPVLLDAGVAANLGERAWAAQVPLVVGAGAVPGIPGVLAEYLVRRLPEIDRLCIATTGPWRGTETARKALTKARPESRTVLRLSPPGVRGPVPRRWRFPEPVGTWPVAPVPAIELDGFADSHCVDTLEYLEPQTGPLARTALRVFGRRAEPAGFASVAQAHASDEREARIEVEGSSVVAAAAAAVGILVRALLAGRVPAGLFRQGDALNPSVFLEELEKRELRVRPTPDLSGAGNTA
jgi:NAD(P)-dependent dehydrogenase (short-subunit alcohol dehydrogenase family)